MGGQRRVDTATVSRTCCSLSKTLRRFKNYLSNGCAMLVRPQRHEYKVPLICDEEKCSVLTYIFRYREKTYQIAREDCDKTEHSQFIARSSDSLFLLPGGPPRSRHKSTRVRPCVYNTERMMSLGARPRRCVGTDLVLININLHEHNVREVHRKLLEIGSDLLARRTPGGREVDADDQITAAVEDRFQPCQGSYWFHLRAQIDTQIQVGKQTVCCKSAFSGVPSIVSYTEEVTRHFTATKNLAKASHFHAFKHIQSGILDKRGTFALLGQQCVHNSRKRYFLQSCREVGINLVARFTA